MLGAKHVFAEQWGTVKWLLFEKRVGSKAAYFGRRTGVASLQCQDRCPKCRTSSDGRSGDRANMIARSAAELGGAGATQRP